MRAAATASLLAVLASAPARAAEPRPADVRHLLYEWRVDEASALHRRLQRTADQARGVDEWLVEEVGGQLRFYQGRYREALTLLRRAASRQASPPRALLQLTRLVAATSKAVTGHVERASAGGHFRFRVPKGKDELLVPFAGQTLEAIRQRLREDLGFAPGGPVRVEVYSRPEVLARVSPLTVADIERTGTVALCKYNRLMIVSPSALPRGYAWRDTLAHEYVHLVVGRLSRNRAPIWLQEGLAKFLEARWRSGADARLRLSPAEEHLLASAVRGKRRMIRWSEMHPSMAKLPSQEATALAFAQAHTAVDFIVERFQHAALRRLLAAIRGGTPAWAAVRKITGLTPKAFQRTYERHLRGLKLRAMPGLVPERVRFGKTPTKERRVARLKQRKARRFFRLADMLRQRRHTRAAVIEYRKARALVGQRDWLVANALAAAYLELGNPSQAINALLPVLEYYPEIPGAQVTVGSAYLRAGNRQAASAHLEVALRLNPFDPRIHCGLARSLPSGKAARLHARTCAALGGR